MRASQENKRQATAFLQTVEPVGLARLRETLLEAVRVSQSGKVGRRTIIYVGSAEPPVGGSEGVQYLNQILQQVGALNRAEARIHVIGVGLRKEHREREDFLRNLATQNGGTYQRRL